MVNPAYSLNLRERIHHSFTVTGWQQFVCSGFRHFIVGRLRGPFRPLVFGPQWGQKTFPENEGRSANDVASISMPASIGCPITRQVAKILAIADSPPLAGGH
jgi:hypothetical protein